jgi:aminoglycoside 2'-N-acetyltransferase I
VIVQVARTADLAAQELRELRSMLEAAFDSDFSEHDWDHTVGGVHFWIGAVDGPISHASVVERTLVCGNRPLTIAYVEAVATRRDQRQRGHATRVMARVAELIRASYALGALSTKEHGFYAGLGWELWHGPSFVDGPDGIRRTQADDGDIMILRTPTTPALDLDAHIVCDWRAGDVW